MSTQIPEIDSLWKHKEKNTLYRVILITNEKTERPEEFPITVCYQDIKIKVFWSRPLDKFLERMELISDQIVDKSNPCCEIEMGNKVTGNEKITAKFTAEGGLEEEKVLAKNHFQINHHYEIVSADIGQWDTRLQFKDVPGKWNICLFDVDYNLVYLKFKPILSVSS